MHMGKPRGNQAQLPRPLPRGDREGTLSSDNACLPGTRTRHSVPKEFIGGWLRKHPPPSMFQNSGLLEGKQESSISHPLRSRKARDPDPPHSHMPASSQPCRQTFLEWHLRPPVFALSCLQTGTWQESVSHCHMRGGARNPLLALCLPPASPCGVDQVTQWMGQCL